MPNLICSVKNCLHNKENCCELNEIAVKGREAKKPDTTCCSTFCECSDTLRNEQVDMKATDQAGIQCSAKNCTYNKECKCDAGKIDICGCGANKAEHTVCSTFSCK